MTHVLLDRLSGGTLPIYDNLLRKDCLALSEDGEHHLTIKGAYRVLAPLSELAAQSDKPDVTEEVAVEIAEKLRVVLHDRLAALLQEAQQKNPDVNQVIVPLRGPVRSYPSQDRKGTVTGWTVCLTFGMVALEVDPEGLPLAHPAVGWSLPLVPDPKAVCTSDHPVYLRADWLARRVRKHLNLPECC